MSSANSLSKVAAQTSDLLGPNGWFEDFAPGQRIRHPRSSTIGEIEGSFLSKQVMNTAHQHFNDAVMTDNPLGPTRLVFGLASAATVFGLAAQDTTEHAIAELGYTGLRFSAPIHHGDTLEAFTEVLEVSDSPDRDDAGIVRFKHWGRRQDGVIAVEGERIVLLKRRSHWDPANQ